MKTCKDCGKTKDLSEFPCRKPYVTKKGQKKAKSYMTYCKDCRNKRDRNNPNTKKHAAKRRFEHVCKYKYNITPEDAVALFEKQNSCCAICKQPFPETLGKVGAPSIDHDHSTGKVRGILCINCNVGLGHFKDNVQLLQQAINYLNTD